MRYLKSTEIAKFIFEEMEKKNKNYEVEYSKILDLVSESIIYNQNFQKNDNGEIRTKMTKEEIKNLKETMLNGVEEYYDSINEEQYE